MSDTNNNDNNSQDIANSLTQHHSPTSQERYCSQCNKAKKACFCHTIRTIKSDIPVLILQHPSEVKQAIGTARIASLSLTQCHIYVGENFTSHAELNARLQQDECEYVVLYPHQDAMTISAFLASRQLCTSRKQVNLKDKVKHKSSPKIGLILLDGTWKKAFKIWSLSSNLHALPKVTLDTQEQGQYQIRKSPKKHGISTIEAIYYALSSITQRPEQFSSLMHSFQEMIAFQIKQMPSDVYEQHYGTKIDNKKNHSQNT